MSGNGLAPFVAAAIRDKVVDDQIQENKDLKARLEIAQTVQIVSGGRDSWTTEEAKDLTIYAKGRLEEGKYCDLPDGSRGFIVPLMVQYRTCPLSTFHPHVRMRRMINDVDTDSEVVDDDDGGEDGDAEEDYYRGINRRNQRSNNAHEGKQVRVLMGGFHKAYIGDDAVNELDTCEFKYGTSHEFEKYSKKKRKRSRDGITRVLNVDTFEMADCTPKPVTIHCGQHDLMRIDGSIHDWPDGHYDAALEYIGTGLSGRDEHFGSRFEYITDGLLHEKEYPNVTLSFDSITFVGEANMAAIRNLVTVSSDGI